jgi:hypothetical protein
LPRGASRRVCELRFRIRVCRAKECELILDRPQFTDFAIPVSGTVCVRPLAASEVTVSVSRYVPTVAGGVKVSVTVQCLPGARLIPVQFCDAENRLVPRPR